ncbi:BspA family leucine-rich repeat surface protein [Mycoplasma yeatsii]|uniref:BspA family leucine-rich repeat surface protein n=1 Tax=Mycoplasma yeatsii TaxID=51365 RepID=UPI000695B4D7|nr:BspA family leucine-rich repeat surface protein [Mycoplasma yeatsii]
MKCIWKKELNELQLLAYYLLRGGTAITAIAVVNQNKKIDHKKVINDVWNEKFFNKLMQPMYYGNLIKQLNKELKQKGLDEVSYDFPALLDTTIGNDEDWNVTYKNEKINLQFGEFMPLSKEPTYNEDETNCLDMGWKTTILQDGFKKDYIISPHPMKETVKEVLKEFPWFINGLNEVFKGNKNKEIKGIENWDTSNFDYFRLVFQDATNFDQELNNWDTSNAKTLFGMFHNAESFNKPLNHWNVSKVDDMTALFFGAKSFNQDLNNWDTSNVSNMIAAFHSAESFNGNIINWNLNKVIALDGMFENAIKFNQDISTKEITKPDGTKYNAWDTSNVSQMNAVFSNAKSFNHNVSNWNVDKVNEAYDEPEEGVVNLHTFLKFATGSQLTVDKIPTFKKPELAFVVIDSNEETEEDNN